jgi:branched-chain amino acid transport system substrate-binding protein
LDYKSIAGKEEGKATHVKATSVKTAKKRGGNEMKTWKEKLVGSIGMILMLVMLAIAPSAGAAPATEAKTLEIGVIACLTGPGSDTELIILNGAKLARDWINNKGGVTVKGQKYQIKLLVEDIKSSAEGTTTATIKLVQQDKVKFILGPVVPFMTTAAAQITEPAKVLRSLFWGAAIPDEINPKTPYTFRAIIGGAEMIPGNYDYLVKTFPNVKRVAILSPDEPGGHFFTAVSKKQAEAHGLTVVATESYPWGTQDFYPVWTKILASKPDAVDCGPQLVQPAASILKQGREMGFKGAGFSLSPCSLDLIKETVGRDGATNYFNGSLDVKSPKMTPMIKQITKLWGETYRTSLEKNGDSLLGWDALWCLVQAIEEANSLDPTVVAKTWENMRKIETSSGTGKMGGLKTYGLNHVVVKPVALSKLNKGQVEFVEWYTPNIP